MNVLAAGRRALWREYPNLLAAAVIAVAVPLGIVATMPSRFAAPPTDCRTLSAAGGDDTFTLDRIDQRNGRMLMRGALPINGARTCANDLPLVAGGRMDAGDNRPVWPVQVDADGSLHPAPHPVLRFADEWLARELAPTATTRRVDFVRVDTQAAEKFVRLARMPVASLRRLERLPPGAEIVARIALSPS